MGKNRIYLVILCFLSLPLMGITPKNCTDKAGKSISCNLAENGWSSSGGGDDWGDDDGGWDDEKPSGGNRNQGGGNSGWDTDLDEPEPKKPEHAGTETPTEKAKPEKDALGKAALRKIGAEKAREKFKAGSGGLVPKVPANPFTGSGDKSFEGTAAVKFLGTSSFVLCQQQSQTEWDQIVGKYAEAPKEEMWDESWWSLVKSIEQKLENFRLTQKEDRALTYTGTKGGPDGKQAGDDSGEMGMMDDAMDMMGGGMGGGGYGDMGGGGYGDMGGGMGGGYGDQQGPPPIEKYETGNPKQDGKNKLLAVKRWVRKGIARGKGKKKILKRCTALVPLTSYVDFTSAEDTMTITPKSTMDRKISCVSRGAETQDYPSCRKLVKFWDGFFIAKKLMETAQGIKYQMDATERQENLALDMASEAPDPMLPLKMQKAAVDDQAAVAFQNTFFLGAQYAIFQHRYKEWPTRPQLAKDCQPKMPKDPQEENYKKYLEWFKSYIQGFVEYAKKIEINNLMEEFNKEEDIMASCPMPGMMGGGGMDMMGGGGYGGGMDMMGGGGYGGGGYGGGGYGGGGMMGMSGNEGDTEGMMDQARYASCDQVFMQNAQMDAQSRPQPPQGGGMGMGGGMDQGYDNDMGGGYGGGMDGGMGGGMMGGGMGGGMGGEMMAMMMSNSSDACVNTISGGTQLILNSNSLIQLKAQMVQTGLEAVTNLMKGMMLRKQSAKIQSLIDGLPVPDPNLDKLSQTEEDLIASICQISPEEQICKDFQNRTNGFYSSAVNMTPPKGANTVGKLKTDAATDSAIRDIASDLGDSEGIAADTFSDFGGEGGEAGEAPPKVKSTRKEDALGGGADSSAELAVGAEGGEAAGEEGGEEESAAEGVALEGGSEARSYSGPGFRAESKRGRAGSLDQIAGGDSSMGFGRAPASDKDIAPKTAEGLFKIISNRYENVSKDRLMKSRDDILR